MRWMQDGCDLPLRGLFFRQDGVQSVHHLLPSRDPSPLHRGSSVYLLYVLPVLSALQKWNGKFFERTNLTALGLIVQLGHDPSDTCAHPSRLHDLMVFDQGGVHRLVVRYCKCGNMGKSIPKYVQLQRKRWFPATFERPSTVFTYKLLNFFHTLQNRNKCNPYDFYHTIVQLCDAAGLDPEIVGSFVILFLPMLTDYL